MKRAPLVLAACAALLLCLPLYAFAAIHFDGKVENGEWFDYPLKPLFSSANDSQCGIDSATARFAVQPEYNRVLFGFTAAAPGVSADSPVGVSFLLRAREIGRWQQISGVGDGLDDANYSLDGKAHVQLDSANGGCTFEIALGYKSEAALAALQELDVQLFDPQGTPSRQVECRIVTAEPAATTKATTTEKTTTTKAPTTEKTTTTKAPTTEKTTTSKEPTTAKLTTTLPVYTTAPQATTSRAPAAPQATAAASAATQQTQPGTSLTEVIWYTEIYTAPPVGADTAGQQTLWTYAPPPTQPSQEEALPTLALPAPEASRPSSRGAPLLYAVIGLLVLLAAVLIALWFRAQRHHS
ncbi:MAG: hypothetical protein FWF60_02720 [Oscillospiraceae bacterium]|nr:hypothetical protein [Oscillospiraceae bacterium]